MSRKISTRCKCGACMDPHVQNIADETGEHPHDIWRRLWEDDDMPGYREGSRGKPCTCQIEMATFRTAGDACPHCGKVIR